MKKARWIVVSAICLVLLTVTVYAAVQNGGALFNAGGHWHNQQAGNGGKILAMYDGREITSEMVSYQRKMRYSQDSPALNESLTDQFLIQKILESWILLDEAERLGITVTEDEIEQRYQNALLAYTIDEGKQMLDAFCAGANLSIEEYYALVREQIPGMLARQKLLDHVGEEYCRNHGLEFTKVNPPKEMVEAQNQYVLDLLEQYKEKITIA